MLFLRRLPPNKAWLLVFRDGVLTAVEVLQRVTALRLSAGLVMAAGFQALPGAL
jgi:hypothetical protein